MVTYVVQGCKSDPALTVAEKLKLLIKRAMNFVECADDDDFVSFTAEVDKGETLEDGQEQLETDMVMGRVRAKRQVHAKHFC